MIDALRKERERELETSHTPAPRRKTEPKRLQNLLGMLRRGEGSGEDKKGAKKETRGVDKTAEDPTAADQPTNDQVSHPCDFSLSFSSSLLVDVHLEISLNQGRDRRFHVRRL